MTNRQWEAAFPNDDACRTYLTACRWPTGVVCPRCGNPEVGEHGTRAFNWQCYACSVEGTSYRFSVLVGTVFENTKYPLREWFRVIHLMLTSKKGISALQIHRMIGTGSYRTAWSMCHRIRAGLANEDFRKLIGIVEEPSLGQTRWWRSHWRIGQSHYCWRGAAQRKRGRPRYRRRSRQDT
jgi:transposase-like protein